ncbi:hypothetical protein DEO72_LG5g2142 [Vigna unguiculata]|uniref:Uncharacterized protein n=1 Tax=Vigna unguiculata TaxID=3917 RepID=A0A4D6M1Z3_VIGUN|nr:hypothetical protein DEO72_LG5g2142 [Vigna unguiculata]
MKGEEKSEEIEMVYTIVGAGVISANDRIRGYKGSKLIQIQVSSTSFSVPPLEYAPRVVGFIAVGEICNARLSELFLAQMGSSPLSENYSNSPPLVLSARLSEDLSLERDGLA